MHNKKLFLLDMDGTIYLGGRLFDFTLPFFEMLRQMGASYMFLTNNSSKSSKLYLDKLSSMGIEANADNLITSTHATARYILREYGDAAVYASGTAALVEELAGLGVNICQDITEAQVLVMGYDTELSFQKLENICIMLGRKEVAYVATNPDWTCPTEYGYVPDCGSVAWMIEKATNRSPKFIGKPMTDMVDMALERSGVAKSEAIIIGDRLYTDVACGLNAGIDAALVLSGESTIKDLETSEHVPTYVLRDLGELMEMLK